MNDFDVMHLKNFKKDKKMLACETLSGDRFVIRQIALENVNVVVRFADGTRSKPEMLRSIETFETAKELQKFLLKI